MTAIRLRHPEYAYLSIACWFAAGGFVTAAFSASLAMLTSKAEVPEVLAFGMVIPCFTWVVQLSASAAWLLTGQRRLYWGDLGRVCLLGSIALLPAAIVNILLSDPPQWISAANVILSVAIMGADLFRRSARHGIGRVWPLSWCLTITVNMLLFLWSSAHWW
jgi:hypothetical protein